MSEKINTLIKLLTKYEVRIPIIQRDYAQGRDNEKCNEVRKNLIKDIKTCLDDGGKPIDFNFVYGTVADGIFYPVDGQQRLTTLYLLHWFLACNCDKFDDFTSLKGFSYMTRNSASEFFALLKNPNNKLRSLVKESKNLRKDIENQSWFQVEWGYDPTVDAALTFLNDLSMNTDFRNKATQYYERLENSAINFTHIVEDGDGAEIKAAKSYIRMNARGKTLEPFENLKAMIDSIDNKLLTALDFTSKYDSKYIDTLYSNCSGFNLKMKTAEINRKSLNCLKNIYNLNCQLKGEDVLGDEAKFISKIYEYSQKNLNSEEKHFFNDYFCMAIAVFEYFNNEPHDEVIKNILEAKGDFYANDNKSIVAVVLYIYYFYNNKSIPLTKEQIKKCNYVLYNLNLAEWSGNFLESIDNFTKAVAENKDVFDYFCNTELADIQNTCQGVLEDINVRIKEQKIKVEIINTKELPWDYFNELEIQSSSRKIQYLLHISGYWSGSGDYEKLCDFMNIAKRYFNSYDNNLEWRKIFAIATYLECDNKLKTGEYINENCGSKHIWDDTFTFWNDEDDIDLSVKKPQLEKIKIAYENKETIDNIIKELPNDSDYDTCWLKYAIKYDYRGLLDKELKWNPIDGIVIIVDDYCSYRYDLYIMHTVYGKQYGLKNLTRTAKTEHKFESNTMFTHSNGTLSPFTTGDRSYIMRLNTPIDITNINEHYSSNKCMHYYDVENNLYYIYTVSSAYNFTIVNYDITSEVEKQQKEYDNQLAMLSSYGRDNYLEIKAGKKKEWRPDIYSRSIWKKEAIPIVFSGNPPSHQIQL